MFYSQRLCSIIRRGTAAAGTRRDGGNANRSVSTSMKPWIGMSGVTLSRAVECSSSIQLGAVLADVVILLTPPRKSSSTGLTLSGVVMGVPGGNGQPRASAD